MVLGNIADFSSIISSSDVFFRSRIQRVLEEACRTPMLYIVGGNGYGKSQSVRMFLDKIGAKYVNWLTIGEEDNDPELYWGKLLHSIIERDPQYGKALAEIGFPTTSAQIKKYIQLSRQVLENITQEKQYTILDNFHLITSNETISFLEKLEFKSNKLCVIIISHTEPAPYLMNEVARGAISLIDEETFKFTVDEIHDFFNENSIALKPTDVDKIMNATHGWPLAVWLLVTTIKRGKHRSDSNFIDDALEKVRNNIFSMIDIVEVTTTTEHMCKQLVKLSLVYDLPLAAKKAVVDDLSLILAHPRASDFIWFDSLSGDYRIQEFFIDFLQSKLFLLSDEEISDVYRTAAKWCDDNANWINAMRLYAKLKDWERMSNIALERSWEISSDQYDKFVSVVESVKNEQDDEFGHIAIMNEIVVPFFFRRIGKLDEAVERFKTGIARWEKSDVPFIGPLMFGFYNNMGFTGIERAVITHEYNFDKYFLKAYEIYNEKIKPPYGVIDEIPCPTLNSYACMVGYGAEQQEIEQYIFAIRETSNVLLHTFNGSCYGLDDLAEAEYACFTLHMEAALRHAKRSISKAHEKQQYEIEAAAVILLIRCGMYRGDYHLVDAMMKRLKSMLNTKSFTNRQLFYDLAAGILGVHTGIQSIIPRWLTSDDVNFPIKSEKYVKEQTIRMACMLELGRYEDVLNVEMVGDRGIKEAMPLFGFVMMNAFKSVAAMKLRYNDLALKYLEDAYNNSLDGAVQFVFILLRKNMRELAEFAISSDSCTVPKKWLESVALKATAYAKRTAAIAVQYKKDNGIEHKIILSDREKQILKDLYRGLSRQEIAETQFLSINTIKTIMQTMYTKLGAESNIDAIRIAIEHNLLQV